MRSKEVENNINALKQDIYDLKGFLTDTEKEKWQQTIDTVLNYIKTLEEEVTMLENTKNICPALNTSGALCPIKSITTGEPIENALVMPCAENVTKEIENDIRRKIKNANRFNPFNGKFEK